MYRRGSAASHESISLPRPLRLHVPGGFYHVTLRGNHRRPIFVTVDDRRILVDILVDALDHFQSRVHAYCWMTNHIHMVVQISDAPLGRLMHRFSSKFARAVQVRIPTTGHLFERRYFAQLVDVDAYLLQLVKYIHLNPVRAAMVKDAAGYEWSSHRTYLQVRSESWLTTAFVLEMLHADPLRAADAYRRFMEEPETIAPTAHSSDPRVLGDDSFLKACRVETWSPGPPMTLDDLISRVCQALGVTADALASRSQARRLAHARACVAQVAVTRRIASLAAVARTFRRDESSIRQSLAGYLERAPGTLDLPNLP